jgi:tetratricopeptide (TPR) repeat protein
MKHHLSGEAWQARVEEFRRLVTERPNDGDLWLRYAQFLEQECDNPRLVVTAYENVQRLLPYLDCRPNLGSALVEVGRTDEGLTLLRQSIQEEPNAPKFGLLAAALLRIGEVAQARVQAEKAIELEPGFEEPHYLFGESLRRDPTLPPDVKWTRAAAAFREAVRLDPNYRLAWQKLGFVLCNEPETIPEGIEALQRARALGPTDGWTHIYLANAYWQSGDLERARESYLAAIAAEPDSTVFQNAYNEFLDSLDSPTT